MNFAFRNQMMIYRFTVFSRSLELAMLFFLIACGTVPPPSTAVPSQPSIQSEEPSLIARLSMRDNNIICSDLPKDNLRSQLINIVETVERPPWVPMRAATCLTELYPSESLEEMTRWITAPDKKGLAFLMAGNISKLPDDIAQQVAQAGLLGPHAKDVRLRLSKQNDPRILPLLQAPQ